VDDRIKNPVINFGAPFLEDVVIKNGEETYQQKAYPNIGFVPYGFYSYGRHEPLENGYQ
jgi:hypothetical protein